VFQNISLRFNKSAQKTQTELKVNQSIKNKNLKSGTTNLARVIDFCLTKNEANLILMEIFFA
jgi:hypothetical protein